MNIARRAIRLLSLGLLPGGLLGCADIAEPAPDYQTACASCHSAQLFSGMSEERVFRTLEAGIMTPFADRMSVSQRRALARDIATAEEIPLRDDAFCADRTVSVDPFAVSGWNGWSPGADNSRYHPEPGLSADDVPGLELVWAFGFAGDLSSYSQPAVLGDHVFVGSNAGSVYALLAETGCVQWRFEAGAPVRTAMVVAPVDGGHAVLFGDQTGRFYAVDAGTGEALWSRAVDAHPAARITGSPVVHGRNVFVPVASWEEMLASLPDYPCCTFRGSVVALDTATGDEVWKSVLQAEAPEPQAPAPDGRPLWGPSGSPTWSTPTVDAGRGVLYVTTGNNYTGPATGTSDAVLALDMNTGQMLWARQLTPGDVFSGCATCQEERGPDFDFGSSAILGKLSDGGDILLAGQKSGVVYGLDPDENGRILWETRVARGSTHGGVQWGMATDGAYVYVPIADGALIGVVDDDLVSRRRMDPDDGGGLVALRVDDGTVAWEAPPSRVCEGIPRCSPSQLAAATAIPGIVFSGAMDGHIRAYAAASGAVVWDLDTAREYDAVNRVQSNGGALNGNGPVVSGGRVFVNSGYNHFGTMTGNVLLAFAP
jgi:polyvinyl alcohol dehydrogenase (cytochrome)